MTRPSTPARSGRDEPTITPVTGARSPSRWSSASPSEEASTSLILNTLILSTLVDEGRIDPGQVSAPTVRRLYAAAGLSRRAARSEQQPRTRLRWQAERPGALWHGDVCHLPQCNIGGRTVPVRIHGLLDDASRYVVALEAHSTEREVDMLGLLVDALRRHGKPDALYLDNGSTYRGEVLRTACSRLGITLLHAKPYDPQARGKMERFWRTLREGCLSFLGEVASLKDIDAHGSKPSSNDVITRHRTPG
ncbi:DDE-type integrase/transposase/recombinase [Sorangium sp. So ce764]